MYYIKETKNDHQIIDLIRNRWSIRAFAEKPISEEKINSLFEAARWAASANNEQPWEYLYAHKGSEGFRKIWSALLAGNQPWAGNAAVLVVSMARKIFQATEKENTLAQHDLGMANANLLHQSTSMDIYAHPMAGFDKSRLVDALEIADDMNPVCIIALGYRGDPDRLDEPYKTREQGERKRKPISEFARRI